MQYDDAGLDVAGPWAVFTAHESMMSTFQGLTEFMDDHSGSGSGAGGVGGGGGGNGYGGGSIALNGRIDRLVQRSPYLTLLLNTASSLWPHRGNHWGKQGGMSSISGSGGSSGSLGLISASSSSSLPDERCGELLARMVCDLWLAPDHLPNHDGVEATGRAERRKARLEFNQQQALAAQQSSMLGGALTTRGAAAAAMVTAGSIGQSGSSKSSSSAWTPPPAPASKHLPVVAAQGVLVCSAQLLADPDLHSVCVRRPWSDLFPTCAPGGGGRNQGGLASAIPLPPPSVELQRFMEQQGRGGGGGGGSVSPLDLELEAQRREADGDPAHANEVRATFLLGSRSCRSCASRRNFLFSCSASCRFLYIFIFSLLYSLLLVAPSPPRRTLSCTSCGSTACLA